MSSAAPAHAAAAAPGPADYRARRRWIGAALLGGLATKVVIEQPWGPALVAGRGWDIALAPFGHAAGTLAGLAAAGAALLWQRRQSRP